MSCILFAWLEILTAWRQKKFYLNIVYPSRRLRRKTWNYNRQHAFWANAEYFFCFPLKRKRFYCQDSNFSRLQLNVKSRRAFDWKWNLFLLHLSRVAINLSSLISRHTLMQSRLSDSITTFNIYLHKTSTCHSECLNQTRNLKLQSRAALEIY